MSTINQRNRFWLGLANEGGIPPLVALVRDGSAEGKTVGAAALWNLAANGDNQAKIANEGVMPPLVALVRDGSAEGKTVGAGALNFLGVNADYVVDF